MEVRKTNTQIKNEQEKNNGGNSDRVLTRWVKSLYLKKNETKSGILVE